MHWLRDATPAVTPTNQPTDVKVVPAGGSAVTVAAEGLVGAALVSAGAASAGVVTDTGAEGALGLPPWVAAAVVVYFVLGVRPGTRQLMVGHVELTQVPPPAGHMMTV